MTYTREQQIIVDHIKPLLDLLPTIEAMSKQVIDHPTNLGMMADNVFVCRKSCDILEEIQKRLRAVERGIAFQAASVMTQAEIKNYKSETCTISDNSTPYVKFPQRPDEEGYDVFVKQLPMKALRPHYPAVGDLIAEEMEKGNQIPFGLKGPILSYDWKLRVTTRKDL